MNKKVVLIYPYFLTPLESHTLFAPLGISYLSAQIKETGIDAVQYDCTFENFTDAVQTITGGNPAIVGIYIMVSMSKNALRLLGELKKWLKTTLFVCGGPLPTLYPDRFAHDFDVVFTGAQDNNFSFFCKEYIFNACTREDFHKKMKLTAYRGIYCLKNSLRIVTGSYRLSGSALNTLPLPDREGTQYKKYQEFWKHKDGSKPAVLMTSYGCPFDCEFCSKPVYGNVLVKRDLKVVMREIENIKNLGFNTLWIADDTFTLDTGRLREFCRLMLQNKVGMKWSCLSRVRPIDFDLVLLMKSAGCSKVYLGLESGSDETLKLMKKGITVREGEQAVRLFNSAGIKTAGFFMAGYPGETVERVEETLSLALELPLDEISISVPYPLAGSKLFERVSGIDYLDDWEFENEIKFLYRSDFDNGYLEKRVGETLAKFNEKRGVKSFQ